MSRAQVVERLRRAGCVFPEVEAEQLLRKARADVQLLEQLVCRREIGEPLAWITGTVSFCGLDVKVAPGVYVPRAHSEPLARLAAALLPRRGRAIDLGTGSGAVAMVMLRAHPHAAVIGIDRDPVAAACARSNGVTVVEGDMFGPAPSGWRNGVDVITAVLPYVPSSEMAYLPHDVAEFEPRDALDGGPNGLRLVEGACTAAPTWLRPGGHLLLELGGGQLGHLNPLLSTLGLNVVATLRDEDRDLRGLHAVLSPTNP